jgi:hypothetical protein
MDGCQTVKITLYKKAGCPWSAAIIGFLDELNIPYEIKECDQQSCLRRGIKGGIWTMRESKPRY